MRAPCKVRSRITVSSWEIPLTSRNREILRCAQNDSEERTASCLISFLPAGQFSEVCFPRGPDVVALFWGAGFLRVT